MQERNNELKQSRCKMDSAPPSCNSTYRQRSNQTGGSVQKLYIGKEELVPDEIMNRRGFGRRMVITIYHTPSQRAAGPRSRLVITVTQRPSPVMRVGASVVLLSHLRRSPNLGIAIRIGKFTLHITYIQGDTGLNAKSVKFQALTNFMRALMAKHANDEFSRVENPECTNNYRVKAKQMEANFPALLLRHLPAYLNARSSQHPRLFVCRCGP